MLLSVTATVRWEHLPAFQITAATGRKFTIKKEMGKTGWLVERVE